MGFSVNTNVGALAALRSLSSVQGQLNDTQARIESGFKVNSAADSPSTFVIAQGLRADVASLKAVKEGINFGKAALTTASSAATEVSNKLTELQEQLTAANNEGLPIDPIQEQVESIVSQIDEVVTSSEFSGINILDGSKDLNVLSGLNGATLQVTKSNVTTGGLGLTDFKVGGEESVFRVDSAGAVVIADGNTFSITKSDGTAVTFEFDNNAATAAGNIAVTVGADDDASLKNLLAQINAQTGLNASVNDGDADTGAFHFTVKEDSGVIQAIAGTGGLSGLTNTAVTGIQNTFTGAAAIADGDTITLTRNDGSVLTFELEDTTVGNGIATGNTQIGFLTADTQQQRLDKLVAGLSAHADLTATVTGDATGNLSILIEDTQGTPQAFTASIGGYTAGTADVVNQNERVVNSSAQATLDAARTTLDSVLSKLGTAENRLESQETFTQLLTDSLTEGVGILVDADLAEESARLQSLQTKEQLGLQSLSIANAAPQSILSLFR